MKVLSINYPKQQQDEEKIQNLVSTYQRLQEHSVLQQMSELNAPKLDLTK